MGKRENADYQHFLLLPQFFESHLFQGCYNSGLCGKGLSLHQMTKFETSAIQKHLNCCYYVFALVKNIMRKEGNDGDQHFLFST